MVDDLCYAGSRTLLLSFSLWLHRKVDIRVLSIEVVKEIDLFAFLVLSKCHQHIDTKKMVGWDSASLSTHGGAVKLLVEVSIVLKKG